MSEFMIISAFPRMHFLRDERKIFAITLRYLPFAEHSSRPTTYTYTDSSVSPIHQIRSTQSCPTEPVLAVNIGCFPASRFSWQTHLFYGFNSHPNIAEISVGFGDFSSTISMGCTRRKIPSEPMPVPSSFNHGSARRTVRPSTCRTRTTSPHRSHRHGDNRRNTP
jgi:hypothetical protein